MPNIAAALLQRNRKRGREGKQEVIAGWRATRQQCVGTTGSISVKQPFQKALMAEGRMKQKSKQVQTRCFAS